MSQDNENKDVAKPLPGPGVHKWLAQIIGQTTFRPSRAIPGAGIDLPQGLAGSVPPDRTMDRIVTDTATSMIVIDLDVSVGTEDPEILQGIIVQFSGLPDGVTLNAGQVDHNGVWTVPADALPDLSVIMPATTKDFDLDVMMQVAGSAPQRASIRVANDFQETALETAFMIRLAPTEGDNQIRFSVYADGSACYDRILKWPEGNAEALDIHVPYQATAFPFEIVMRHAPLEGAKPAAPKFMGVDIDGDFIRPDSPAIAANGTRDENGLIWQGDLVIDVRHALRSILADADTASDVPVDAETSIAMPDTEIPEPEQPSTPETPESFSDDVLLDDAPVPPPEPDPAPVLSEPLAETEAVEDTPLFEPGILVMDASYDDLQRPAFTGELRRLRDFIRSRPTGNDGEVYARLGIDVTKWRDMVVVGPLGAVVELDPLLPALAPPGGIDNTRFLSPLGFENDLGSPIDAVLLRGLAPGTLLTHGKNNGDGTWTVPASDLARTALLPPMAASATMAVHVAWGSDHDTGMTARHTLLIGPKHIPPACAATKMRALKLPIEAAVFDPKGGQSLSLTLGDIPPGVLIAEGKNHGGGVWTLETTSGSLLTVYAAVAMKPFSMTMTCVALNIENGDSTVVSRIAEIMPTPGRIALRNEMAA